MVAFDVFACPRCGDQLRVIATVQDPRAVQAILAHLGRSLSRAPPASSTRAAPVSTQRNITAAAGTPPYRRYPAMDAAC